MSERSLNARAQLHYRSDDRLAKLIAMLTSKLTQM
jgi:hypothetical protein